MVKNTAEGSSRLPQTPTTLLADALGVFSKAANHAIATAEKQAAAEVARVMAEAEEIRRERDEAVEALNAIKLEKKEWQRRMDGWKTSVDKSDMTIEHQNETIAQLREEANQWKGQLLRYEDTARREAQDWKEQYLRAEQERIRLAARVDELVTEQLAWNTHNNTQNALYASRIPYHDVPNGVASKRASTAALPQQRAGVGGSRSVPPVFDDHDEHLPVPKKPKAASTKPVSTRVDANAQQAGPSTSRTPKQKVGPPADPRYDGTPTRRANGTPRASTSQVFEPVRVIRRVQAVIEVPVKQESDDDAEDLLSGDTGSEYDPEATKIPGKSARKAKPRRRSSVKSRKAVQSDEDSDYDEPPLVPPPARRRPPPNVDSDDELTMGPEESFSAQRVTTNATPRQRAATTTGRPPTNTKKRKLDGDSAPTPRSAPTKVARK